MFDEGQDTGPDNFGLAVLDNVDVDASSEPAASRPAQLAGNSCGGHTPAPPGARVSPGPVAGLRELSRRDVADGRVRMQLGERKVAAGPASSGKVSRARTTVVGTPKASGLGIHATGSRCPDRRVSR